MTTATSAIIDNLPDHRRREARRAALLARRGSPEWVAAGEAWQATHPTPRPRTSSGPTELQLERAVRRFHEAMPEPGRLDAAAEAEWREAVLTVLAHGRPTLGAALRREVS